MSFHVEFLQRSVGFRISLLAHQTKPANRYLEIPHDTLPVAVHLPEIVLCRSISLLSGQARPASGFHVDRGHASPFAVTDPEAVLGVSVVFPGCHADRANGFYFVLRCAANLVVCAPESELDILAILVQGQRASKQDDYRLCTLIEKFVLSDLFQKR